MAEHALTKKRPATRSTPAIDAEAASPQVKRARGGGGVPRDGAAGRREEDDGASAAAPTGGSGCDAVRNPCARMDEALGHIRDIMKAVSRISIAKAMRATLTSYVRHLSESLERTLRQLEAPETMLSAQAWRHLTRHALEPAKATAALQDCVRSQEAHPALALYRRAARTLATRACGRGLVVPPATVTQPPDGDGDDDADDARADALLRHVDAALAPDSPAVTAVCLEACAETIDWLEPCFALKSVSGVRGAVLRSAAAKAGDVGRTELAALVLAAAFDRTRHGSLLSHKARSALRTAYCALEPQLLERARLCRHLAQLAYTWARMRDNARRCRLGEDERPGGLPGEGERPGGLPGGEAMTLTTRCTLPHDVPFVLQAPYAVHITTQPSDRDYVPELLLNARQLAPLFAESDGEPRRTPWPPYLVATFSPRTEPSMHVRKARLLDALALAPSAAPTGLRGSAASTCVPGSAATIDVLGEEARPAARHDLETYEKGLAAMRVFTGHGGHGELYMDRARARGIAAVRDMLALVERFPQPRWARGPPPTAASPASTLADLAYLAPSPARGDRLLAVARGNPAAVRALADDDAQLLAAAAFAELRLLYNFTQFKEAVEKVDALLCRSYVSTFAFETWTGLHELGVRNSYPLSGGADRRVELLPHAWAREVAAAFSPTFPAVLSELVFNFADVWRAPADPAPSLLFYTSLT